MLSRKVEYLRYAEVKGKNSRTIWPDMTAFSKSVLMHASFPWATTTLSISLCGVSERERERELLLVVYIMIKFLFQRPLPDRGKWAFFYQKATGMLQAQLTPREKAFIAADNQVSSRVTESAYFQFLWWGRQRQCYVPFAGRSDQESSHPNYS